MAKEKTGATEKTANLLNRPRGRPATGKAKSTAERQAEFRAKKKAEGICPCCGHKLPTAGGGAAALRAENMDELENLGDR